MDIFDLEWDAKGSSLGIVGRAYVGWGYFTAIWTAGAVANVFVTPRDCYARTIAWGLSDLTLSCSAAAAGVGARLFVFDRSVKPRATLPIGAKAEHFSTEGLDWVVVSSRSGDLLLVPLANVDRHVSVRLSFVGWCCPAR